MIFSTVVPGSRDQALLLEECEVVSQGVEPQAPIRINRGRRDLTVDIGVLDEGVLRQDGDDLVGIRTAMRPPASASL